MPYRHTLYFLFHFCYKNTISDVVVCRICGVRPRRLQKKNARARSQSCSHVLPALLVIPQTNYAFSSSSSSLLFQLPQSSLSFQLQLDLDKDGFFPFLLHSPLLWLKRDLPVEITRKRSHTHTCTEHARLWTAAQRRCI